MKIDRLHYISQQPENGSHLDSIAAVLDAGGKWIQLRIKGQSEDFIYETAEKALALCNQYGATLILNDYPEIARQVNVHGVHLGLQDMPIKEARTLLGEQMIIGGTANTFKDVQRRVKEGVDYIGLGPYRFTTTKKNLSPILGLEGYQSIMAAMDQNKMNIPVIAIGGIESKDIEILRSIGLHGIAISGALTQNPKQIQMIYDSLKQENSIC